ncbi:MAG: HEAT repeat domain-containing protein, partial [Candidatus Omnitrophota bacterium]
MNNKPKQKVFSSIFKNIALALCFILIFEQTGFAQISGQLDISNKIGNIVNSFSLVYFRPPHLRYISYDKINQTFKVILNKEDSGKINSVELADSARTPLKFFYTGLAIPNESFWVNLRPDSPDRIIDDYLAETDVGKILLEADLELKKDLARAIYPSTPEGKEYWDKIYRKIEEIYGYDLGNASVSINTRIWITPGEVIVCEDENSAYIYKAALNVSTEAAYLSNKQGHRSEDNLTKIINDYSSELMQELILPKIFKEVNTGKRYASLRQVYYSLILAQWFKRKFYGAGGLYPYMIDKKSLTGLTSDKRWSKDTYFKEYQKSFREKEYDLQVQVFNLMGRSVRTYSSGGVDFTGIFSGINSSQIKVISSGSFFPPLTGQGNLLKVDNSRGTVQEPYFGPGFSVKTVQDAVSSSIQSPSSQPLVLTPLNVTDLKSSRRSFAAKELQQIIKYSQWQQLTNEERLSVVSHLFDIYGLRVSWVTGDNDWYQLLKRFNLQGALINYTPRSIDFIQQYEIARFQKLGNIQETKNRISKIKEIIEAMELKAAKFLDITKTPEGFEIYVMAGTNSEAAPVKINSTEGASSLTLQRSQERFGRAKEDYLRAKKIAEEIEVKLKTINLRLTKRKADIKKLVDAKKDYLQSGRPAYAKTSGRILKEMQDSLNNLQVQYDTQQSILTVALNDLSRVQERLKKIGKLAEVLVKDSSVKSLVVDETVEVKKAEPALQNATLIAPSQEFSNTQAKPEKIEESDETTIPDNTPITENKVRSFSISELKDFADSAKVEGRGIRAVSLGKIIKQREESAVLRALRLKDEYIKWLADHPDVATQNKVDKIFSLYLKELLLQIGEALKFNALDSRFITGLVDFVVEAALAGGQTLSSSKDELIRLRAETEQRIEALLSDRVKLLKEISTATETFHLKNVLADTLLLEYSLQKIPILEKFLDEQSVQYHNEFVQFAFFKLELAWAEYRKYADSEGLRVKYKETEDKLLAIEKSVYDKIADTIPELKDRVVAATGAKATKGSSRLQAVVSYIGGLVLLASVLTGSANAKPSQIHGPNMSQQALVDDNIPQNNPEILLPIDKNIPPELLQGKHLGPCEEIINIAKSGNAGKVEYLRNILRQYDDSNWEAPSLNTLFKMTYPVGVSGAVPSFNFELSAGKLFEFMGNGVIHMLALYNETDPSRRAAAAWALGELKPAVDKGLFSGLTKRAIIDDLSNAMLRDKDPYVRAASAWALSRYIDSYDTVIKGADLDIRIKDLIKATEDKEWIVRYYAVLGLASSDDPRVTQPLINLINKEDNPYVLALAVQATLRLEAYGVVPVAIQAMERLKFNTSEDEILYAADSFIWNRISQDLIKFASRSPQTKRYVISGFFKSIQYLQSRRDINNKYDLVNYSYLPLFEQLAKKLNLTRQEVEGDLKGLDPRIAVALMNIIEPSLGVRLAPLSSLKDTEMLYQQTISSYIKSNLAVAEEIETLEKQGNLAALSRIMLFDSVSTARRVLAADAFSRIGDTSSMRPLIAGLNDSHPAVRSASAKALHQLVIRSQFVYTGKDGSIAKALSSASKDRDWVALGYLVDTLRVMGNSDALETLSSVFNEQRHPVVQKIVLEALNSFINEGAALTSPVKSLLALAGEKDTESATIAGAMDLAGKILQVNDDPVLVDAVIYALIDYPVNTESYQGYSNIIGKAIEALKHSKQWVERLKVFEQETKYRANYQAVNVFKSLSQELGSSANIKLSELIVTASDTDVPVVSSDIRIQAITEMGQIFSGTGNIRASICLMAIIDSKPDSSIANAAIAALILINSKEVAILGPAGKNPLINTYGTVALNSDGAYGNEMQQAAIKALGNSGIPEAINPVKSFLKSLDKNDLHYTDLLFSATDSACNLAKLKDDSALIYDIVKAVVQFDANPSAYADYTKLRNKAMGVLKSSESAPEQIKRLIEENTTSGNFAAVNSLKGLLQEMGTGQAYFIGPEKPAEPVENTTRKASPGRENAQLKQIAETALARDMALLKKIRAEQGQGSGLETNDQPPAQRRTQQINPESIRTGRAVDPADKAIYDNNIEIAFDVSSEEGVRARALENTAEAFKGSGNIYITLQFIKLIESEQNSGVCAKAVNAILEINSRGDSLSYLPGKHPIVDVFKKIAQDKTRTNDLRNQAVVAIGQIKRPEATTAISEILKTSEDKDIIFSAADAACQQIESGITEKSLIESLVMAYLDRFDIQPKTIQAYPQVIELHKKLIIAFKQRSSQVLSVLTQLTRNELSRPAKEYNEARINNILYLSSLIDTDGFEALAELAHQKAVDELNSPIPLAQDLEQALNALLEAKGLKNPKTIPQDAQLAETLKLFGRLSDSSSAQVRSQALMDFTGINQKYYLHPAILNIIRGALDDPDNENVRFAAAFVFTRINPAFIQHVEQGEADIASLSKGLSDSKMTFDERLTRVIALGRHNSPYSAGPLVNSYYALESLYPYRERGSSIKEKERIALSQAVFWGLNNIKPAAANEIKDRIVARLNTGVFTYEDSEMLVFLEKINPASANEVKSRMGHRALANMRDPASVIKLYPPKFNTETDRVILQEELFSYNQALEQARQNGGKKVSITDSAQAMRLLFSKDNEIGIAAAFYLAENKDLSSLGALNDAFEFASQSDELRAAAILRAIGQFESLTGAKCLRFTTFQKAAGLALKKPFIRWELAYQLGTSGDPQVVSFIQDLLKVDDNTTRVLAANSAFEVITRLAGEEFDSSNDLVRSLLESAKNGYHFRLRNKKFGGDEFGVAGQAAFDVLNTMAQDTRFYRLLDAAVSAVPASGVDEYIARYRVHPVVKKLLNKYNPDLLKKLENKHGEIQWRNRIETLIEVISIFGILGLGYLVFRKSKRSDLINGSPWYKKIFSKKGNDPDDPGSNQEAPIRSGPPHNPKIPQDPAPPIPKTNLVVRGDTGTAPVSGSNLHDDIAILGTLKLELGELHDNKEAYSSDELNRLLTPIAEKILGVLMRNSWERGPFKEARKILRHMHPDHFERIRQVSKTPPFKDDAALQKEIADITLERASWLSVAIARSQANIHDWERLLERKKKSGLDRDDIAEILRFSDGIKKIMPFRLTQQTNDSLGELKITMKKAYDLTEKTILRLIKQEGIKRKDYDIGIKRLLKLGHNFANYLGGLDYAKELDTAKGYIIEDKTTADNGNGGINHEAVEHSFWHKLTAVPDIAENAILNLKILLPLLNTEGNELTPEQYYSYLKPTMTVSSRLWLLRKPAMIFLTFSFGLYTAINSLVKGSISFADPTFQDFFWPVTSSIFTAGCGFFLIPAGHFISAKLGWFRIKKDLEKLHRRIDALERKWNAYSANQTARQEDGEDHALDGAIVTRQDVEAIAEDADLLGIKPVVMPQINEELRKLFGPRNFSEPDVIIAPETQMHTLDGRKINGPVRLGNTIFVGDEYLARNRGDFKKLLADIGHEQMAQWVAESRPDLNSDAHELGNDLAAVVTANSPSIMPQGNAPGGIDLRVINFTVKHISSGTEKVNEVNTTGISLSNGSGQEITEINRLIRAKIIPSSERLKECLRKIPDSDREAYFNQLNNCLAEIFML